MIDSELNRDRRCRQGVTLVELLVVVVILAMLAVAVVPQFAGSTDDAKLATLDWTLASMRGVLDLYYAQHGEYPSANGDGTNSANSDLAFLWQLSRYTDADGDAVLTADATHVFGPYLETESIPLEPMTSSTELKIETAGTPGMTAEAGDPGGWRFDNITGQFIVNHSAWDNR